MTRRVAILVPARALLAGLAAPTDLLQLANRFAHERTSEQPPQTTPTRGRDAAITCEWLSLDGGAAALAAGGTLPVDGGLDPRRVYDAVFVGDFEAPDDATLLALLAVQARLTPWLQRQYAAGALIAAVGHGVFLVAESGLLDGRAATAPWWRQQLFHRRHPAVRLDVAQRHTEDGRLHCAGSLSGLLPMSLRCVQQLTSPNTADWLAKTTLIDVTAEPQPPRAAQMRSGAADDPLVAAAQYQLQQRYAQPTQLAELARTLAVSPRTLGRRFQRALGVSPQAYVQNLRIEAAQRMLVRTSLRVDRIALQVGYGDPGFFKRLFRLHTGMTPTAWRARMQATEAAAQEHDSEVPPGPEADAAVASRTRTRRA